MNKITRVDKQMVAALRPLLDYLADECAPGEHAWQGWHIAPITGGRNNLLYHVSGNAGQFAVKFTVRDDRDRAGREFNALAALQQAGLKLGPMPVLLDRERYAQPVVVQTWLAGEARADLPASDAEWDKIVQHLAMIHTVKPDKVSVQLRHGTLHAYSISEGRELIHQHTDHIPPDHRPPTLIDVLRKFEATPLATWEGRFVSLNRLDNNILNYIRGPGPWRSVDWECSGWGDPAFDIANLIAHVAWLDAPPARWPWVIARYCASVNDATVALRIGSYTTIMYVWWVVRMARYLYEIPRGLDPRLVDWSDDWLADMTQKYHRYVKLAMQALDTVNL